MRLFKFYKMHVELMLRETHLSNEEIYAKPKTHVPNM